MANKNDLARLVPDGQGEALSTARAEVVALPLASRLLLCADRLGGKRALAEAAGLSESQLFRYLNGDSEMSAAKAVALAQAAGVDVGWLLTGEGKPEGQQHAGQPPFRAALMEDIVRLLSEIMVDFEWRLNPSQRAKYATYAYMAFRQEEMDSGTEVEVTVERLMEGLWYFGKATFDELLNIHTTHIERLAMDMHSQDTGDANVLAQAVSQGHYQFYNSTGGDAVNRWLGTQVSSHSAERLLKLINFWRTHVKDNRHWLDVGCGNGRELDYVLRHAPELEVHGTEIARAGLAHCQKLARSGRWREDAVVEGDVTCLPFETGSMGMVYCRGVLNCLPYFDNPDANNGLALAVRELARVTAKGGLLAITVPLNIVWHLTYHQKLDMDLLVDLLERQGLEILETRVSDLPNAKPVCRTQGEIIARKA